MNLLLETDLDVTPVILFAEVGVLERRPELARLCQRALTQPDGILSEALCQAALPGISAAGGRSLLRGCVDLDLCDREGRLLPAGVRAAQDELVAIPEQGAYRLWLATHPLFGQRLLHLERTAVDGRDQDYDSLEELPFALPRGQVFTSVVDPALRFLLRGQPSWCRIEDDDPCDLTWELRFACAAGSAALSQFTLTGELAGDEALPFASPPEAVKVDHAALLRRLTGGAWDEAAGRLRVPLAQVSKEALESFQMDRPLGDVELPRLGRFEGATLREVPLAPEDASGALAWALARFQQRRGKERGYLARPALEALFTQVTQGTPLAQHGLVLPLTNWLLQDRQQARDGWGYWQVAAGEDLSL